MMKSDVLGKPAAEEATLYPWLGDFEDTIVLFHKYGAGVVVSDTSLSFPVGFYDDHWAMENFTIFQGNVMLSN